MVLVQGAGQLAQPGALLPLPLQVRVQTRSNGRGAESVRVRWRVVEGTGAVLESEVSRTDSTGLASNRLTLGPGVGSYRVEARVAGMDGSPVGFRAEAILIPELTLLPTATVLAGDTILLEGRNLSPDPQVNVVTFSGIRGRVVSASPSELRVEVPPCLPTRTVQVQVHLGSLSTGVSSVPVQGRLTGPGMTPGDDLLLDGRDGLACLFLPSQDGASYLLVPHSTGTVGGGVHGFSLVGLTGDGLSPTFDRGDPLRFGAQAVEGFSPPGGPPDVAPPLGAQEAWDLHLRELESRILAERETNAAVEAPPEPTRVQGVGNAVPQMGETRQFQVLNRTNEFEKVTARLRIIGTRSLVHVDENVPPGGFGDTDLAFLAGQFDNPIHPVVTGAFGVPSDLDGNGRVIILFTPAVNRLTENASEGYVGGFFFGVDLLQGQKGSNEAEIFYALVPDPQGREGPALSKTAVLDLVPAIMAHEFQHMVHFNQRILVGGASHQEALWLSEALAQMAEDLVGDAFWEMGARQKARDYWMGNWGRARRFLQKPSQVSVLFSLPPGSLAERGAGWLLLKQVSGQAGRHGLLAALTRSTETGLDSFTKAMGRGWPEVVADWAGSLYLDGIGIEVRPELEVQGVNLREALSRFDGTFPLDPLRHGASSFSFVGSLWSSAPEYFIITPPSSGGIALGVGGPHGLRPDPALGLQFLVVRLR